ncbi:MAG: hypothetical protein KC994_21450 [Candidatus Omnitrophica bacterium]|nr:hypothetical protein [Candidatus Omnitrophota bacterium]
MNARQYLLCPAMPTVVILGISIFLLCLYSIPVQAHDGEIHEPELITALELISDGENAKAVEYLNSQQQDLELNFHYWVVRMVAETQSKTPYERDRLIEKATLAAQSEAKEDGETSTFRRILFGAELMFRFDFQTAIRLYELAEELYPLDIRSEQLLQTAFLLIGSFDDVERRTDTYKEEERPVTSTMEVIDHAADVIHDLTQQTDPLHPDRKKIDQLYQRIDNQGFEPRDIKQAVQQVVQFLSVQRLLCDQPVMTEEEFVEKMESELESEEEVSDIISAFINPNDIFNCATATPDKDELATWSIPSLNRECWNYIRSGHREEALLLATIGHKLHPGDPWLIHYKAIALYGLKRGEEAVDFLESTESIWKGTGFKREHALLEIIRLVNEG